MEKVYLDPDTCAATAAAIVDLRVPVVVVRTVLRIEEAVHAEVMAAEEGPV